MRRRSTIIGHRQGGNEAVCVVRQRAGDHRPVPGGARHAPLADADAIAHLGQELVAVPVFQDRITDRTHATRIFREHVAEVQATVPVERLLTFDLREGWAPLCAFLGVPVLDIPFPKTNSSKAFHDEEWKQE
jgi:hypothetical protein